MDKTTERIHRMIYASVYPLYVAKAERKGRTQAEVDTVISWLTGYDADTLKSHMENRSDFATFFAQAPQIHPNAALIKGSICGVKIAEITDPVVLRVRQLDKLIDDLAKGKSLEKLLPK